MEPSSSTRSVTGRRVLRTWRPPWFEPETAGTVIYVHGYFTTVDKAWDEHRLPAQFAASRQNAVFVAVSAPASRSAGVVWESINEVRRELAATTGEHPPGPIVVVAHSGGYRTAARWIEDGGPIDQLTLLDALYGDVQTFASWIGDPEAPRRSMNLVVCREGAPRANADFLTHGPRLHSSVGVVRRDGVPAHYEDFTSEERRARVLHIIAQESHMGLVTRGGVLPVLLRRSPLRLAQPRADQPGGVA